MLKQTLNKGISTPIAITIILILAIIVGGATYWYYLEIGKEETELPEIEIPKKEETKEIEDETADLSSKALATEDWKTYVNEEYGFEIKYPKEWIVKEERKEYTDTFESHYRFDVFYPEDITEAEVYGNVAVAIFDYYKDRDNDSWFDREVDLLKRSYSDGIIEEITIGDLKGLKATVHYQIDKGKSMEISELFIDRENQRIYKIWLWAIDFDEEIYQEQSKLILSTFRFIEEDEIKIGKTKINYEEIERIQKSVDEGHQPWQLNPVGVAISQAFLFGFTEEDKQTLSVPDVSTQRKFGTEITEVNLEITHKGRVYIITLIQPIPGYGKIWAVSEVKLK